MHRTPFHIAVTIKTTPVAQGNILATCEVTIGLLTIDRIVLLRSDSGELFTELPAVRLTGPARTALDAAVAWAWWQSQETKKMLEAARHE